MALLATKEYTGTGSQTDFLYDFTYFEEAHIHGYVNEVEVSISFADPTTVRFAVAPTLDATIKIRRETPTGAAYYTYPDPAYLKSSSLNDNQTQALHLAEELTDKNSTLPEDIATVNALAAQVTIDAAAAAADKIATNADVVTTTQDAIDTATDVVTTNADVVTSQNIITNLQATWYLPRATETNLDDNGAASTAGDTYFNSTLNKNRVYDGASWGDTGNGSTSANTINVADAGGKFTESNVEGILQSEIAILNADNTFGGNNTFTATLLQLTKGADLPSANTLVFGNDGNYVDITGTTSINIIGSKNGGSFYRVHFDDSLLIEHSLDIILPGGTNITTQAGDEAEFFSLGSGIWRCINYQRNVSV